MTTTEAGAPSLDPTDPRDDPTITPDGTGPSSEDRIERRVCPYLRTAEGWRSAAPTRDQRCHAVEPAVRIPRDKQQLVCLAAAHVRCDAFVAAVESRERAGLVAGPVLGRPIARTAPMVDTPVRPRPLAGLRLSAARRASGAIVGGLMVVAVAAFVFARFGVAPDGVPSASVPVDSAVGSVAAVAPSPSEVPSTSTASASATPAPSSPPSASPSSRPTPAPSASASVTAAPTAAPSAAPTPTLAPGTFVRYKVKSGDTLSGIASKYATTVQAIVAANGITNPGVLRIGQVILVPK